MRAVPRVPGVGTSDGGAVMTGSNWWGNSQMGGATSSGVHQSNSTRAGPGGKGGGSQLRSVSSYREPMPTGSGLGGRAGSRSGSAGSAHRSRSVGNLPENKTSQEDTRLQNRYRQWCNRNNKHQACFLSGGHNQPPVTRMPSDTISHRQWALNHAVLGY